MAKRKAAESKPAEPVWWRWKVPQIEAAEREPERYAKELTEMREYSKRALAAMEEEMREFGRRAMAELEASPGLRLYRQYADWLQALPEAVRAGDLTLDDVVDTICAVLRHSARKASHSRERGASRASKYAPRKDAWIAAAKAAVASHAGATKRNRMKAAADAIEAIEPNASRRTITAFVGTHWCKISSASRAANLSNLSV